MPCPACNGEGVRTWLVYGGHGETIETQPCDECARAEPCDGCACGDPDGCGTCACGGGEEEADLRMELERDAEDAR